MTFAVRAAVELPEDALYFTINGQPVEMFNAIVAFDAVTAGASAGEWEEVSLLLQTREHTLTWS